MMVADSNAKWRAIGVAGTVYVKVVAEENHMQLVKQLESCRHEDKQELVT